MAELRLPAIADEEQIVPLEREGATIGAKEKYFILNESQYLSQ